MKELAEKMGVTTGTLTVTVDNMEKWGFLARKPHEREWRSYLMALTERRREHFEGYHRFHVKLAEEMTGTLTKEGQTSFATILDKTLCRI